MRVLIVDDDESIRSAVTLALSVDEGVCEIRAAVGGVDALQVVKTFQPDVVLMDYWMPEMSGSEAARALRLEVPEARIVAYSGVLFEKPEWADDFILKDRLPSSRDLAP